MANPIEELHEMGQSTWLDYIRRGLITSGELTQMVEKDWIRGMTSNPTIFQKAISGSGDYREGLDELKGKGLSPYEAFLRLGGDDIRMAADVLRPIYDRLDGAD